MPLIQFFFQRALSGMDQFRCSVIVKFRIGSNETAKLAEEQQPFDHLFVFGKGLLSGIFTDQILTLPKIQLTDTAVPFLRSFS